MNELKCVCCSHTIAAARLNEETNLLTVAFHDGLHLNDALVRKGAVNQ
jgi:hypothetical protein